MALTLSVPESPGNLRDQGREEQLRAIIVQYYCDGDHKDPWVAYKSDEIPMALQLKEEANNGSSSKYIFLLARRATSDEYWS